jgi:hypothetical protein
MKSKFKQVHTYSRYRCDHIPPGFVGPPGSQTDHRVLRWFVPSLMAGPNGGNRAKPFLITHYLQPHPSLQMPVNRRF